MRKTPPEIGQNRLISVLSKHNSLQINTFIFLKNLHNPEVPGSNPGLATWKSRTYVKSWVLCCFCVRFAWGFVWGFCHFLPNTRSFKIDISTAVNTFESLWWFRRTKTIFCILLKTKQNFAYSAKKAKWKIRSRWPPHIVFLWPLFMLIINAKNGQMRAI